MSDYRQLSREELNELAGEELQQQERGRIGCVEIV